MTIANSDFEDWRRANPSEDYRKFKFNLKKMSVSGALFDWDKLIDVSKTVISRFSSDEVLENLLNWSKEYDSEFYKLLSRDKDYSKAIFSIDRNVAKPRKDIAKWDEAKAFSAYFYDELFVPCYDIPEKINKADAAAALKEYSKAYFETDDKNEWFGTIKSICPSLGFASETKEYKQNPEKYRGSAGDICTVIRVAVTGRQNTPDLCSIMHLLGKERCLARIENAVKHFEN